VWMKRGFDRMVPGEEMWLHEADIIQYICGTVDFNRDESGS